MHVRQATRHIQQQCKGLAVADDLPVWLRHLLVGQPRK